MTLLESELADTFLFLSRNANDPHRKGVADQELAKKEAERARKRQLEGDDDDGEHFSPSNAKRQLSRSLDSVSSISTRFLEIFCGRRREPMCSALKGGCWWFLGAMLGRRSSYGQDVFAIHLKLPEIAEQRR